MDAGASIPTVDEPVDPFDERLGAGTGPLGSGPPGSALRGISMVGGSSSLRLGDAWPASQSLPRQPTRHEPLP